MKKITLFMLIVFTISTQAQIKAIFSSIDEYYDGTSWQTTFGSNYAYDANNNLITETQLKYDSSIGKWSNSIKTSYVYNASNKVTLLTDFQWNAVISQFVNSYKISYSYSSGKYIGDISQKWVGSVWVNDSKTDITYDSNGLLENAFSYIWDGSQWVIDTRDTVTYGGNNKISTDLSEKWNGAQWINSNKTILTYNVNNKIITYSSADWDAINSVFNETDRTDYVWDAIGNRTSETNTYAGSMSKQEYAYDTSNLMSNYANPFKDKTGVDYVFEDFPYVNKLLVTNYFYYDTTLSSYSNTSRTTYDYNNSITLGTENFETENATITVFPNPSKDFLSIQTSLNTDIDKVIVTDVSGKTVLQQNQNATQVDIQNLAKGMYLIQVFSGDKKWQSKFLKE